MEMVYHLDPLEVTFYFLYLHMIPALFLESASFIFSQNPLAPKENSKKNPKISLSNMEKER